MMKSDTGKTIEQYRDIIKQLKIKVIKQKERIEELEYLVQTSKSKGPLIASKVQKKSGKADADSSFNIQGDTQVMQLLYENAKELGLTLEMLFRAADIQGQKSILLDDFRIFLNKLNIGMDHQQITRLLYIFDEDCSGTLTYQQYYDVLASYSVNSEQMKAKDKTRGQEALLRFINYLNAKNISDNDAFKMIDKTHLNKFNANDLSEFLKKYIDGYPRSMRIALYNYFDYEDKQYVAKETFIEVLNKGRKTPMIMSSQQQQQSQQQQIIPGGQQQIQQGGFPSAASNKEKVQFIKKKFETNAKTAFTKILEIAVQNVKCPERGILFKDISTAVKALGGNLQPDETFAIFKQLDTNLNGFFVFVFNLFLGVVYYDECSLFFQDFKTPDKSDYIFFIINLARDLQSIGIPSIKFLQNNQIELEDNLDENEFSRRGANIFKIYQQDAKILYKRIRQQLENPPIFTGRQLAQLIDSYRPDAVDQIESNPGAKKTRKRKEFKDQQKKTNDDAMKKSLVNEGDVEKQLRQAVRQLKPMLTDEDYFTTKDKKAWKTIFTNEMACLRFCLDTCQTLTGGAKWVDPEFGYNKSIPEQNLQSLYFYENMVPSGSPSADDIQWLSLAEINRDQECKFFDDGATANDVMQSSFLGDCWFVSALSILATHDELLQGQFKPTPENIQTNVNDQEARMITNGVQTIFIFYLNLKVWPYLFQCFAKYGMYPMRFFKDYKWHYVVIDDRLPTLQNGELLHGKCRPDEGFAVPDEYWVSLIEKAYAKLHNCYQSLFSGFIDEALEDMTGYAAEKRQIFEGKLQTKEEKDEFWKLLQDYTKNDCMIGCSANGGTEQNIVLDGEDTGLKSGHAYAILDVFDFKHEGIKNYHQTSRLIRMRNPWGFGEWKLKWADNDEKLAAYLTPINKFFDDYVKQKIKDGKDVEKFTAQEEDGTFLICFKDWRRLFNNLFVSLNFPDEWTGKRIKDEWTDATSGGFPVSRTQDEYNKYTTNPQFFMNIKRKDGKQTQVFISCGQYDGRLYRGIKYPYKEVIHPSSLMLWKLEGDEKKLEKFDQKKLFQHSGSIKTMREICIPKFYCENGTYIIIASTKEAGSLGEFTINLYFDCNEADIQLGKVDDPGNRFQDILEEKEDIKQDPKYLELLTLRKKIIN